LGLLGFLKAARLSTLKTMNISMGQRQIGIESAFYLRMSQDIEQENNNPPGQI
jgi:hypothetical protein